MGHSFQVGGALTDDHAAIYIERQADRDALIHLRAMDYLLVIEPRQQGKTSLINHLMRHPTLDDMAFVYLDVTTPDRSTEATWYQTLCPRILRQLRGLIPRDQWPPVPQYSAGWRDLLCDVAMFATDARKRVVIALDEIGAVTFPGATEFFSVLRDVYNSRQAEAELRQLTFLLAGAFHPRDLIKDDRISPFNIAQRVRLEDFTMAQVRELVGKGSWTNEQATLLAERIHYWTDGQPYLTQLLCSYLGSDATSADVDASIERLRREDENHLPPLLARLDTDDKLREYIERILAGERIKFYPRENRRQAQLELLGIIKADEEGCCSIRNHIYEQSVISPDSSFDPGTYPKHTVKVGLIRSEWADKRPNFKEVTFRGKQLAGVKIDQGNSATFYNLYLLSSGKYLVYAEYATWDDASADLHGPLNVTKLQSEFPELATRAGLIPKITLNDEGKVGGSAISGETDMNYERGLDTFRQLAEGTDWYQDFAVHEAPLRENLRDERRYGPSEQTRRDRARLVDQLNALALRHLGISFNDLCLGRQPSPRTRPTPGDHGIIERLRRIEEKLDQGRAEDRQAATQILDAIAQNRVQQAEAAEVVAELRAWMQSVQQSGLPLNPELREALGALSEHTGSAYQYLQLALPIIPGILTYNVELGSQHQLDLKAIWERIKTRLGKGAKGDGATADPETLYGIGNRWAVLIGVNEYEDKANYGQLHVCVKDVEAIRERLTAGGFAPGRIRLLTDHMAELPTRANILTALKAVADATEPDDLLLVYYSGHGDEAGGESYLVARDGRRLVLSDTALPVSRVKAIIEEAPARAKVIILDACHSGADIGGKGPEPMSEEFIRRVFEQAEGLAILASCKQGQLSYEWQESERSVFTHYMLEALAGQADRDGKGFVTIQDANRHVANGVKLWASQRNASQTPTLQSAVAGDIILSRYARSS